MIHASLCTGIGACELAATWMGWTNAFSCEIDEFCNKVLKYYYPNSKHYGNIFEQDFREWRGRIDVLTAGFPCQPFSVAGQRNGAEDHRYLWNEVFRAIAEIRPAWFIGENVGGITTMVLPGKEVEVGSYTDICGESYSMYEKRQRFVIEQIRLDLESLGYFVQPIVIPACAVGAPHRRDRIWFVANCSDARAEDLQREGEDGIHATGYVANPDGAGLQETRTEQQATRITGGCSRWHSSDTTEQGLQVRLDDGKQEDAEKTRSRADNRPERYGGEWDIADSYGELLEDGHNNRTSWNIEEIAIKSQNCAGCWEKFPTQSPVCRGDDGLPFDVHDLAIPFRQWREESIKAYGNTMVPQVVYEIFLAIEQVEETFTN